MLEVGAVVAVGAAALAFVAGMGTYLYIRFTQHRRAPNGRRPGENDPAGGGTRP